MSEPPPVSSQSDDRSAVDQKAGPSAMSSFERLFGAVGKALADALMPFSLDLLGIICRYIVCDVATRDAKPLSLFVLGSAGNSRGGAFYGECSSVAVAPDGSIWVGDYQGVQIFNGDGQFLREAHCDGWCPGIAFDTNGEVFLSNTDENSIMVFTQDGRFLRKFGESGSELGQFIHLMGIAVDGKGLVFAVDCNNQRVQVLRRDGSVVYALGNKPRQNTTRAQPMHFRDMSSIALFARAQSEYMKMALSDLDGGFVQTFDLAGNFFDVVASSLNGPDGLAFDSAGNLYVCESQAHRVVVVGITSFGSMGVEPGQLDTPRSICVDSDGRILVGEGSTWSGCRVQVFAFEAADSCLL